MQHRPQSICDSHVHIVGEGECFPQLADRAYTAGIAGLDSLREIAGPLGVTRFVLVQPSFYGSDNRCMLQALSSLGERGRGVAVLEPEALTEQLLKDYTARGVRGVRVNLYSPVGLPAAGEADPGRMLKKFERRLLNKGWHIEVIAPLAVLGSIAGVIAGSEVPIVLNHYGLPGTNEPESPQGRILLDLLGMKHVWVKLSAPYRVLANSLATTPPAGWLAALLNAAPERCVWGSDWPHTPVIPTDTKPRAPIPYRALEYGRVLDEFLEALPASLWRQILEENPRRIYEFSSEFSGN